MTNVVVRLSTIVLLSLSLSGCVVGYNRVLFMTKSNIGLDVDTKPPTAEITISRKEGTIGPTFEGGVKPPVLASFRSSIRGILGITANVSSTFAGGDAADTMTKLFGAADDPTRPPEDSTRCLSAKPEPTIMNIAVRIPGPGEVKPFVFGTDTSIGLKVAWSGTTAEFPDSVKFGYNRKEFALAPVFAAPAAGTAGKIAMVDGSAKVVVLEDGRAYRIDPETVVLVDQQVVGIDALKPGNSVALFNGAPVRKVGNSYVWRAEPGSRCAEGQYRVNVPSFLATVDHESTAKGPGETGMKHLQYFATGQSATNLALHKEIREVMLKRLDPEAANRLRSFRDHQKAQQLAVKNIQATFDQKVDKQPEILKKARELRLVTEDTTAATFKQELSNAADANDPTITQNLEQLETFAKSQ